MVNIEDLRLPIAVWKAVEGEREDLIILLRSKEPLGSTTRKALADWLEGTLTPVQFPKGRPPKGWIANEEVYQINNRLFNFGHDTRTEMGVAGFAYELFRRFIRKRGWHLKKAGKFYWSTERLREAIAKRQGIDLETFTNYLNRPKPKPRPRPSVGTGVERYRRQIAYEIHHAKVSKKR